MRYDVSVEHATSSVAFNEKNNYPLFGSRRIQDEEIYSQIFEDGAAGDAGTSKGMG